MKKVKLNLNDDNYRYLTEIAKEEGWTLSGLINRAIDRVRGKL